jgi:hypothetical protein
MSEVTKKLHIVCPSTSGNKFIKICHHRKNRDVGTSKFQLIFGNEKKKEYSAP